MTRDELNALEPGDLVRHKSGSKAYIIHHGTGGGRFVAVRVAEVSNPTEWDKVDAAGRVIST